MENQIQQEQPQATKSQKNHKMFQRSIFFLAIAIVLFLAIWLFMTYLLPIQTKNFQAVFLSNGQVYYGHIQKHLTGDYLKLTDIYYLQFANGDTNSNETTTDTNSQDFALIKLGRELHGPKDMMLINKDHILFIETLRENSDLVTQIRSFETQ